MGLKLFDVRDQQQQVTSGSPGHAESDMHVNLLHVKIPQIER